MPYYRIKSKNSMNIINNTDHVINPHTGQPLKIGTKTYRKIVKDRCLNLNYDNRKDYIIFDGSDLGDIDLNKIKAKLKKQPDMIYIIKNKQIWAQRRKINMTEIVNYIIKCTIDVLKNNVSLKELSVMNDKEIEFIMSKEINQKLVGDADVNLDGTAKELYTLDEHSEVDSD
jgi:hypothetical protein